MSLYDPEHSRTHVERARGQTISVLRRPRIQALLQAGAEESQRIEDLAWEVALALNIDSGIGWILDGIGRIVGRGRGSSATDDVYRIGLRTRIRINRSHGRMIDLLEVEQLSKPGEWTHQEHPPASLTLWHEEPIEVNETEAIRTNLEQVRGLGVRIDWLAHYDNDRPLRFAWSGDPEGDGFGWSGDDSVGGLSAHAMVL